MAFKTWYSHLPRFGVLDVLFKKLGMKDEMVVHILSVSVPRMRADGYREILSMSLHLNL